MKNKANELHLYLSKILKYKNIKGFYTSMTI